eukprot:7750813-Alexandrium_andersonii.AAC.1
MCIRDRVQLIGRPRNPSHADHPRGRGEDLVQGRSLTSGEALQDRHREQEDRAADLPGVVGVQPEAGRQ